MLALNLTLILLTPPRAQPLAVAQAMVPRQLLQVARQLLQVPRQLLQAPRQLLHFTSPHPTPSHPAPHHLPSRHVTSRHVTPSHTTSPHPKQAKTLTLTRPPTATWKTLAQGRGCDHYNGEKLMVEESSGKKGKKKTLALCREACIKVSACKAISFYKKYEWSAEP